MSPRLQQWIIGTSFVWSLGILTAGYAGMIRPDAAFIASILGSTIGAAGINLRKEEKEEPAPPQAKKPEDPGTY